MKRIRQMKKRDMKLESELATIKRNVKQTRDKLEAEKEKGGMAEIFNLKKCIEELKAELSREEAWRIRSASLIATKNQTMAELKGDGNGSIKEAT